MYHQSCFHTRHITCPLSLGNECSRYIQSLEGGLFLLASGSSFCWVALLHKPTAIYVLWIYPPRIQSWQIKVIRDSLWFPTKNSNNPGGDWYWLGGEPIPYKVSKQKNAHRKQPQSCAKKNVHSTSTAKKRRESHLKIIFYHMPPVYFVNRVWVNLSYFTSGCCVKNSEKRVPDPIHDILGIDRTPVEFWESWSLTLGIERLIKGYLSLKVERLF